MGFWKLVDGHNDSMTLRRVKRFIYLHGQRRNFLSWQQKRQAQSQFVPLLHG